MSRSPTTLGYALLGLLARESRSGYDLARALKRPIGFFWHAGHSQIYPELARLEEAGLTTHEKIAQDDRPDKKLYAVTEAGRAVLSVWVTAPLEPPSVRDELMLKAYSLWLGDPTAARALFLEHAREHQTRMERFEALCVRIEEAGGADVRRPNSPHFGRYLTVNRGITYEREYAAWCVWVADLLKPIPDGVVADHHTPTLDLAP